jgi:Cytochrome c oxidase subunit IV
MSPDTEHSTAPVPPAGEEIHLPGPTIIPLVTALGITFVVIGTTLGWWISVVGGVILVLTIIRWIQDTRRDVGALPEQHQ